MRGATEAEATAKGDIISDTVGRAPLSTSGAMIEAISEGIA
jgi:hypothetical protein